MPKEVGTRMNLANALGKIERAQPALDAYKAVLALDPAHKDAACKVAYFSVHLCEWRDYNTYIKRVLEIVRHDKRAKHASHLIPFNGLMMPVSIDDQLFLAHSHSLRHSHVTPLSPLPPLSWGGSSDERENEVAGGRGGKGGRGSDARRGDSSGPRKLRIGYLSADFRNHPMGRELSVLLPAHAASRTQVVCYAQNPPHDAHDGPYRARFVRSVHAFREINPLSDEAVAELMRADGLDVLVDLMGYTHGARDGVVALRPAALQIGFKGYMSTMVIVACRSRLVQVQHSSRDL